jgi:hypothetical protein
MRGPDKLLERTPALKQRWALVRRRMINRPHGSPRSKRLMLSFTSMRAVFERAAREQDALTAKFDHIAAQIR